MDIEVGTRLRTLRALNGWSQRQLAKRAGVTNSTISMIEQGRVSPSIASLKKVLDGVPISLCDFFSLDIAEQHRAFYQLSEDRAGYVTNARSRVVAQLHNGQLSGTYEQHSPGYDTGTEMQFYQADMVGFVVSGELEITIGGETQLLSTGDGFYIKSARPYRIRNRSKSMAASVIATVSQ